MQKTNMNKNSAQSVKPPGYTKHQLLMLRLAAIFLIGGLGSWGLTWFLSPEEKKQTVMALGACLSAASGIASFGITLLFKHQNGGSER